MGPTTRLLALATFTLLLGCAPINRQIDHWALGAMAGIAQRPLAARAPVPLPFTNRDELERLTRPDGVPEVTVVPSPRRIPDVRLVQEQVSFPSAVKLRLPETNTAIAQVFRMGPLGKRPVVVWVPGQAISASDWESLQTYFNGVLDSGCDVVLYVPPYHLERTPAGLGSGDAMLATDFADHLGVFAQEVSDLRRLSLWLRAQGVRWLGAFGSSMGGGMLLRTVTFDPAFDFLILKQPLVDWNTVIARPEMAPVRARIEAEVGPQVREQAYRALDSRPDAPKLPAERIALLYGQYDQVAPEAQARSLADAWRLSEVRVYPRGHALITVGGATYRDVPRILARQLSHLAAERALARSRNRR